MYSQTTSEVLNKMVAMWNEHISNLGDEECQPNTLVPLTKADEVGLQTTLGWVLQAVDQDAQLGSNYGWQEVTLLNMDDTFKARILNDVTEAHRKACYVAAEEV